MAALVKAAEEAGIARFVYTSYVGVDDSVRAPLINPRSATRFLEQQAATSGSS